jgi:hypothetical protein
MAKEDFTKSLENLVKTVSLFGLDDKRFKEKFVALATYDAQVYVHANTDFKTLLEKGRKRFYSEVIETLSEVRRVMFSESYLSENLSEDSIHKAYIGALTEAIDNFEVPDLDRERTFKGLGLLTEDQRTRGYLTRYQAVITNNWASREYIIRSQELTNN